MKGSTHSGELTKNNDNFFRKTNPVYPRARVMLGVKISDPLKTNSISDNVKIEQSEPKF